MRHLVIIFLIACVAFSCVKSKTKDPVPAITFKGISGAHGGYWSEKVTTEMYRNNSGVDSAGLVIGYEDGDGDLFLNSTNDHANIIYKVYYYNSTTKEFVLDGSAIPQKIVQPAQGYYKGKSVQGEITVPLGEFRSADSHKILKFETFMVDLSDHQSNIVTSQTYTLD